MLNFNINLTSLAVILWSGMLIIAGSIWVLSSQVRKLADIMEDHTRSSAGRLEAPAQARLMASSLRVARRGAPVRVRGAERRMLAGSRGLVQLAAPERALRLANRLAASGSGEDRTRS